MAIENRMTKNTPTSIISLALALALSIFFVFLGFASSLMFRESRGYGLLNPGAVTILQHNLSHCHESAYCRNKGYKEYRSERVNHQRRYYWPYGCLQPFRDTPSRPQPMDSSKSTINNHGATVTCASIISFYCGCFGGLLNSPEPIENLIIYEFYRR